MCDKKNYVLFTDTECLVLSSNFKLPDESQILFKIPREDNMYSFDMKNIVPKESLTCLVAKATSDESMLWHKRLGHINFKNINKLVKENLVRGLPLKCFENDQTCVACLKGKQHRASCKSKVLNPITKPLFMLHMDLFGLTFMSNLMHKKYCLVVSDDYSKFTWVFFLATKDETSEILKNFIKEIENLVDKKSNTTAKLPLLKLGEYEMWEIRIKQYFQVQDYALWEVIENGNSWVSVPQTTQENGTSVTKHSVPVTAEEKINKKNYVKARSLLLMALPNEHLLTFSQYSDAKTLYAAIKTRFGDTKRLLVGLQSWMNKDDIETMSIDDLYNNFKIVEQEVKKYVGASTSTQNMAFMTAPSTSSTNNVNTANSDVSTVSTNVNTASPKDSTATLSDATVYAFLANQPNGSQLIHEDLEQIHDDDLEEIDLKWQLALLSMRARKFYQRTTKKITIIRSDTAGYDKSKVECFNCHKMGHFARECKNLRKQDIRPINHDTWNRNQDSKRQTVNVEETSSKAMLAIDGVRFDWSDMAEEQVQTNMALMAFSDSKVYTDKSCSKTCLKNYETLKKQCDDLIVKLNETQFKAATYKRGLATVEDQLVTYKKNDVLISEEIVVLKREVGLDEFKQPEFNGYGHRDTVLKSTIDCDKESDNFTENIDDSLEKEQVTDNEKCVKPKNDEKPVKKSVRYAELYRSQSPRGNKRNWNGQKSNQLDSEFVMYNKACYGCGSFDHIQTNCPNHLRKRRVTRNNYNREDYDYYSKTSHPSSHRNMTPRAVLLKSGLKPLSTTRPVYTAQPNSTVHNARPMTYFSKQAQSTVQSPSYKKTALTNRPYRAPVNTVRANGFNVVKPSACWVWRPTRPNGASLVFNKCNYIDARGRSNGCSRICPTFVSSLMHKKYCLVVTDDYSRFTWVFFLATKDETSEILKSFIKEIENLVNNKVKIIKYDNGTEFKNIVMDDFCKEKGIRREYSVARTPQQNRVVERRNRTLIEAARTMLADSKLPTTFWAEAVSTACYVQNMVLIVKPHNKTPYELFRGIKLALSFMKPFGCHVTILNTLDSLGKFDGKSDKVTAGTSTNESTCTQEDQNAGTFPEKDKTNQDCIMMPIWKDTSYFDSPSKQMGYDDLKSIFDDPKENEVVSNNESNGKENFEDDSSIKQDNTADQPVNTATPGLNAGGIRLNASGIGSSVNTTTPKAMVGPSYSFEATQFEFFNNEDEPNVDLGNIPKSYAIRKMKEPTPEQGFLSAVFEAKTHEDLHTSLFACFLSQEEPKRISKALSDLAWVEAIQEELLQFKLQKVWILMDFPKGHRAIGTKWVSRNKKDERGIVIRNKERLVSQGHTQEEGIDYDEVFAPIEEEVYVCQPLRFEDPDYPDKVCRVVKALYGLHQAPRAWYETLANYLLGNGFHRGKIDQTLFIKKQKGDILLVQIYVDDIIFGSTKKELLQQKKDGIFISQDKYVDEILRKFNCTDVKSASTPVDLEKPLVKDGDDTDVDEHLYRSMIGSLMHLTASRPDILFVIDTEHNVADLLTKGFDAGRNVKRGRDTKEPQSGGPSKRLVMRLSIRSWVKEWKGFATTASILEAEQDSDAQTRFEAASKSLMTHLSQESTAATITKANGEVKLTATIDGQAKTLTEASLRRHLKLEDNNGVSTLTNSEIFKQLALMGIAHIKPSPSTSKPQTIQPTPTAEEPAPSPYESSLQSVHSLGRDEGSLNLNELTVLCKSLSKKIEGLESELKQTKPTYNVALTKLIKRVKNLEQIIKISKAMRMVKIVLSEDEDATEDSSKQGRKISDIDEDLNISLVQDEEEEPTELVEDQGSGEKGEKEVSIAGLPISTATTTPDVSTASEMGSAAGIKAKGKGKGIMQESMPSKKVKKRIVRYYKEISNTQKKPVLVAQARKHMMVYLKNMVGYKMEYFKGMSYDDIRPIFEVEYNKVQTLFKNRDAEEEKGQKVLEESAENTKTEQVEIESSKKAGGRKKSFARKRGRESLSEESSKK
ncbi:putative ribonuclease H-like domain-containing protein [Tanacetum coccineum]